MDYVITFSDVMAGMITVGLGVITFFIKGWFNSIRGSMEEIKEQIKENDEKANRRIDRLEEDVVKRLGRGCVKDYVGHGKETIS